MKGFVKKYWAYFLCLQKFDQFGDYPGLIQSTRK